MFCVQCDKEVPVNALFCGNCGHDLSYQVGGHAAPTRVGQQAKAAADRIDQGGSRVPDSDSSVEKISVPKRPIIVTIACLITAIGLLMSGGQAQDMLDSGAGAQRPWLIPFLIGSITITSISIVGYAMMRRWGVYVYSLGFIAIHVFLYTKGLFAFNLGMIGPLILIAIGLIYFRRMT